MAHHGLTGAAIASRIADRVGPRRTALPGRNGVRVNESDPVIERSQALWRRS